MDLLIAIIIFLLMTFTVILTFCLFNYFYNKQTNNYTETLEEDLQVSKYQDQPYSNNQKDIIQQKSFEMQSFRPQILKMNLSKLSEGDGNISNRFRTSIQTPAKNKLSFRSPFENENNPDEGEKKIVRHTFIQKIANYDEKGIQIYEKQLKSIKNIKIFKDLKWGEQIREKFDLNRQFYETSSPNFLDVLDILKMQQKQYGGIKIVVQVEVRDCEYDKQYNVKALGKNQKFQLISKDEYEAQLKKLQSI